MPAKLHETVYFTRIFGYLLACLVLTQLKGDFAYLYGWLVILIVYPHVLEWFVVRSGGDHAAVRTSMLIDAVMVGLLISLSGFNLEAGVVLTTLLSISMLIIGGFYLLVITTPLVVSGMIAGSRYHPVELTGGSGFYFTSFAILLVYILFVGWLVYLETRRLKMETRHEKGLRSSLESARSRWRPFIAPELFERSLRQSRFRKPLTVMYARIDGFESVMEGLDERVVVRMLDAFFAEMTAVARQFGGTIDRFTGDGFMVFFGDPVSRGTTVDATRCIEAGLAMQSAFRSLASRWHRDTGQKTGRLHIGIHSGHCLVAEFGGEQRREYTAVGATVRLAERMLCAADNDEVMISGATRSLAGESVRLSRRGCVFSEAGGCPLPVYAVKEPRTRAGAVQPASQPL